jgi:phenylalanine-4-hydroxylase
MMNANLTLTDLYSAEELATMTLDEIMDIIHDIYGHYEDIRKDAFIAYMEALSESKS